MRASRHARHLPVRLAPLLLGGCSGAPSRSLLGAYFPSWMLCAFGGVLLALLLRQLLVLAGIEALLPAPLLVHLASATAFAFALWLLWLA
ncbi:YtcA family lipoprotein [Derxia gummosa]|uniref:Uncharacterized protein YtcA n=1 Tax=Derxia gummosa DSM 723 TaxID=1121388 RepID=A0A8B6X4T1_9BURK|nr:YtcA family lipoprotein [Derxia gummosa]